MGRGRKSRSLEGMHYKDYKGLAFFKRKRGVVRINMNGRIMVDPSTFRRINPNYQMSPVKRSSSHSHPPVPLTLKTIQKTKTKMRMKIAEEAMMTKMVRLIARTIWLSLRLVLWLRL